MIAIGTMDAWESVTIQLDDGGVVGVEEWTPAAGVRDGYAAILDFVAWLDSTYSDTATWTWIRNDSARAAVSLEFGGTYNYMSSAAAQSVLGVGASGSGVPSLNWDDILGTLVPDNAAASALSDNYWRSVRDAAQGAGSGAVRAAVPGLAPYRPRIVWQGVTLDAEALRLALASASNPRQASVYTADDGWITGALGPVSRQGSRGRYRFAAEVLA